MELCTFWKKSKDIPYGNRIRHPERTPEEISEDRKRKIEVRKRLNKLSDQKSMYSSEVWDE